MEFGTLIHGVLERVENAAAERGDRHGTVEEALRQLDVALIPGMFGGGAYDVAWHQRARTELENIYSLWPSSGEPIGSEIRLTVDRGDVHWSGRADRIEQRDGSVAAVDYKTGRTVTKDEAATSIQLGFYLIAAGETRTSPHAGSYPKRRCGSRSIRSNTRSPSGRSTLHISV